MNIDYTVTALMFPAIPLLMSVYSNRFHSLSILIRQLHDEHVYEKHIPPEWKKQFINLSGRITLLRWTILFASFGFLFNMLTVFALIQSLAPVVPSFTQGRHKTQPHDHDDVCQNSK